MIQLRGIVSQAPDPPLRAWAGAGLSPFAATAELGPACFAAVPVRQGADAASACYRADNLLVIANARIDGLSELRGALGDLAPADPAAGPAAHIAAAWHRWGADCARHLYGDYAFALHDSARGETFCARDHIGARPFFYTLDDRRLAFAGAPASLLDLPGISPDLDQSYVATALLLRDFEPHRTFHRQVRKLPAGHSLHLTKSGASLERWWRPERIKIQHGIGDAPAVAETLRLLRQAIDQRIAGHSRVAVHLSGGLDSSLVAVLATAALRAGGKPDPLLYCWQDPEGDAQPGNEIGWVQAIAAQLGIQPAAPRLTPAELAELLLADWTRGADARNLLHEAAIQRHAQAAGATLVLSGWGGDEGFSFHGRGLNPQLLLTGRWIALFREAPAGGLKAGLREFYGAARRLALDWLRPRKSAADLIARGKNPIDPEFARRTPLLPLPRIREFGVQATQIALLRHGSPTGRIEDWALSGESHGIEYGYPLLDRRVLEWVLSLPPRMFKRRGLDRWLAREAARDLVPELIRTNLSKDELLRVGRLGTDLAEAFRLIAPRLDDPAAPLSRAGYFDMVALRRQLAAADASGSGLGRGLHTAIQFLDFE